MAEQQGADGDQQQSQGPQVAVQRVYLKDLSFESPQAPEIFRAEWKPDVKMDLNTGHRQLDENHYEIVLSVTLTVRHQEKTVFLVEIQQAGVFLLAGLDPEQLRRVMATFCPEMLFPYLRETVDSLATRGSFPPLMLAPVNFEALYAQALQQQAEGQKPS